MGPITASRVRELFHYDPDSGVFTRRISTGRHGCHKAGSVLSAKCAGGYLVTTVDGKKAYLHRLAVLYMTGEFPPAEVDHIDTVRSNNAWANLRCVPRRINAQNRIRSRKDRKHGSLLGVKRKGNRWQARINHEFIGSFASETEAYEAYVERKRLVHEGCTL